MSKIKCNKPNSSRIAQCGLVINIESLLTQTSMLISDYSLVIGRIILSFFYIVRYFVCLFVLFYYLFLFSSFHCVLICVLNFLRCIVLITAFWVFFFVSCAYLYRFPIFSFSSYCFHTSFFFFSSCCILFVFFRTVLTMLLRRKR